MKKRFKRDQLFGLCFVLLGIFCLAVISTIKPVIAVDPNDAGPKFFPTLIAIGLIICGACMIVMPDEDGVPYLNKEQWVNIAKYFGLLILYISGLYFVGFLISTPICLFMMINMLAEVPVKKVTAVLHSVVLTLLIYLAFTKILVIILPRGLLFT